VDWVAAGKVSPVQDQGQCAADWAFITVGAVESMVAIQKQQALIELSVQELIDCGTPYGNAGCSGGIPQNAYKYIQANGLCSAADYPTTGRQGTCQATKCTPVPGSKIAGFTVPQKGNETALGLSVDIGPVAVGVEADQAGFQLYMGGVFTGPCGTNVDHGMLLVGYGSTSTMGYWKLKNSWGTSWGEQGYMRLETGKDLCGIALDASYPYD